MFGNDPLQNMKGLGATGTAWGGSVNENRALRESAEVPNASGLRGAYKLDLQGAERQDTIFGEKKGLEELRQEAENMDPSVQKDYMTVMAGTLSPEAYGKLAEDGFEIQQMDPEDIVDSSDKIKARMAEAGVVIHGYNDDLSSKQLEQITGSSAYAEEIRRAFSSREVPLNETGAKEAAEAMGQSERLEPLSRGAKNYMVENGLTPTISNIYKAEHSGAAAGKNAGGGYVASGAYYTKGGSVEQGVPDSLKEQAAAVIERSGEEVTEEGMDRAVRMLQDGLPLTEETYHRMSVLDQLELPLTTQAAAEVAALAAYEGIPAEDMDMSRKISYAQEGAEIKARVDAITEEDIAEVLDSGKELTIRNLSNAHESIQSQKDAAGGNIKDDRTTDQTGSTVLPPADGENNIRFITARRQMEEVRLTMTVEINIKMIRRGISIDTTDLSRLVDDLKSMEKEMMQRMFETGDDAEAQLRSLQYDNSLSAVSEIPGMPVSLVGDLLVRRSSVSITTLQEFTREGQSSIQQYAAMQERYETVGTMPRADLGDSLRKAFEHADTLMKELGIENTEENARAVRILGYNSMEITAENMDAVKDAYQVVDDITRRMTPAATLGLIRDGVNPLELSMEELDRRLAQQDTVPDGLKYNEFLVQQEQRHAITAEEKESYIGIYRMLHQVGKKDGAAIGRLVEQGAEVNFHNLMQAVRSEKRRGMELQADDGLQGTEGRLVGDIEEQIAQAYTTGAYHAAVEDLAAAGEVPVQIYEELAQLGIPATADNALGLQGLRKERGQLYKDLRGAAEAGRGRMTQSAEEERVSAEEGSSPAEENMLRAMESVLEDFVSEEDAQRAFERMTRAAGEMLSEAMEETDTTVDIRRYSMAMKQLGTAGRLSREEDYEIPMEIGGEQSSVRVRILHERRAQANVEIRLETAVYGELTARFSAEDGQDELQGFAVCATEEGLNMASSREEAFRLALEEEGIALGEMKFIQSGHYAINNSVGNDEKDNRQADTSRLYQTAKLFIRTMGASE